MDTQIAPLMYTMTAMTIQIINSPTNNSHTNDSHIYL
nr:MAG TPA: hypothetical protein [Caudoviricetes sp.]